MTAAVDVADGMSLSDLEQLRRLLKGCELAMLADIATGTVLGASAALNLPQEHFDALCRQAGRALAHGGQPRPYAVIAGPRGLRLHLRAPDHPDEVLSLVLPPGADFDLAMDCAHAALAGAMRSGDRADGS